LKEPVERARLAVDRDLVEPCPHARELELGHPIFGSGAPDPSQKRHIVAPRSLDLETVPRNPRRIL
jgi:hypothetical protein